MAIQIKAICANCGAVNEIPSMGALDEWEWLPCSLPAGFEWSLPAGKITPIVGNPEYIDALGNHFSREMYIIKYKIDPEIAYTRMRAKR